MVLHRGLVAGTGPCIKAEGHQRFAGTSVTSPQFGVMVSKDYKLLG